MPSSSSGLHCLLEGSRLGAFPPPRSTPEPIPPRAMNRETLLRLMCLIATESWDSASCQGCLSHGWAEEKVRVLPFLGNLSVSHQKLLLLLPRCCSSEAVSRALVEQVLLALTLHVLASAWSSSWVLLH